MKHSLTTMLLALISYCSIGQCEDSFASFKKDQSFEYTYFDSDSIPSEKSINRITSTSETLCMIQQVEIAKSGKEIDKGTHTISCDNGDIQIDINQYIPDRIWNKFKKREKEIQGNFVIIPKDLNKGQTLPDGKAEISMTIDARTTWKVNVDITERMVLGQEQVSTPAGTFETFKVIEYVNTTVDLSSSREFSNFYQTSWYSKNIGLVKRTRSQIKNPKRAGYLLLTKIQ